MMALSRNARRGIAKQRQIEKSERIAKASVAARLDEVRRIVDANQRAPQERNYYPSCNIGRFAGMSHRGYVCRASGGMGRQRALALKAQGKY